MMNEFARVLSDIITQERKKKTFNVKDLAQKAGITPGYLSNLKLDKRKPPTREKLDNLIAALLYFEVTRADIQRLTDAYNRTQPGHQDESSLLESLIEQYTEKGSLFERFQQGVQKKGIVLKKRHSKKASVKKTPPAEWLKGDRRTLIVKEIELLEKAKELESPGGNIYITWGHHPLDKDLARELEQLREAIRNFLWVDSPFKVFFLWTGGMARDLQDVVDFLAQYIGTSNCYLYELSEAHYLPEYLVIEGFGFIDAKPAPEGQYWIQSAICAKAEKPYSKNLAALIEYLEHLLSANGSRKLPLVQTEASLEKYVVGPLTKKLVEAESHNLERERLLIKPFFSGTYRPLAIIRRKLEALQLPQDVIVPYIDKHQERVQVLKERLTRGKERTIHKRAFLRQAFRAALEKRLIDNKDHNTLYNIEVDLLKAQILGILNAIKQNVNFHCAFVEQEFAIQFELAGDTAFFLFSSSELQGNLPAEHSQIGAAAWTHHPEVISRLHSEFDTKWKEIPPEWRTDSEEGRRNVIDFIVAESLKAMLEADVAPQELWVFMHELADMASYLDAEGFRKELYTREQLAQEIVIVSESFPSIIMPVEIGHWEPTDSIRTRQSLLDHILKRVKMFQVISTQAGIQEYWRTKHYGKYPFSEEWVQQHFQFVYNLLSENKISMEIVPVTERSLVAIELIDHKFVRVEKTDRSDIEGGIALQDKELAQGLLSYITRHLSSMCPEHLKGAQNVAKWFERQFGVTKMNFSEKSF